MVEENEDPKGTVLIVDDNPTNLNLLLNLTKDSGYKMLVANDGESALERACYTMPDIILLDIMMPGIDGFETCRRLKLNEKTKNIPIIFMTALSDLSDKVKGFELGAVDYITKPIQCEEVLARVHTHLTIKNLRENLKSKNRQLNDVNLHLEEMVEMRTMELSQALTQVGDLTEEIVKRLIAASEYRDNDTGAHILRMKYYTQILGKELDLPDGFMDEIGFAAPLHDVGKIGIPDSILLKPGRLTPDEFKIMETHTTIGGLILSGSGNPKVRMSESIALTHHERWDGSGYPKGLKGNEIPLESRILILCDQYDALVMKRPYKEPFEHEKAIHIISHGDGRTKPEHFDPVVLDSFIKLAPEFNLIYLSHKD